MLIKLGLCLLAGLAWSQPHRELQILQRQMEGTILPLRLLPIRLPALPKRKSEVAPATTAPTKQETQEYLDALVKGTAIILNNYPNPITLDDLRDGALDGMLQKLDPHSALMTPEVFKRWQEDISGSYVGVGIQFEMDPDKNFTVVLVLPDGPAAKAKIQQGDTITAIDGQNVAGMDIEEARLRVRGKAKTQVKLSILPKGSSPRSPPNEVTLTRAEIKMPSVYSEMVDKKKGIAYLYLSEFSDKSHEDFKGALDALKGEGMKSLILDLRFNAGGLVDSANIIASNFLQKDKALVNLQMKQKTTAIKTKTDGEYANLKILILINGLSASASEILAGCLQDHGRAKLIGSQSYGKGVAQAIVKDFPQPGYALKLTVANYTLPSGRSIDKGQSGKGGLTPDIAVAVAFDEEAKIYQQISLKLIGRSPANPLPDKTLEKALEQ